MATRKRTPKAAKPEVAKVPEVKQTAASKEADKQPASPVYRVDLGESIP